MAACRSTILLTFALMLTDNASAQSDGIDLGTSRIIIVRIPAGTFAIGSDEVIHADDAWQPCPACAPRNNVERPVHQVTISKDFWMGQFDVTQKQWQELMGNNPSGNRKGGPDAPVDQVSWKDVQSLHRPATCIPLAAVAITVMPSMSVRPEEIATLRTAPPSASVFGLWRSREVPSPRNSGLTHGFRWFATIRRI